MIDIHSHILPQVDDGASSWDTALAMCEMAKRDGITHMVATPHSNDEYFYDRPALVSLLEELRRQCGNGLTFSLGCDFHFSYENLSAFARDPEQFRISGTNFLLVELSDFSIPPWVTTKLDDLLATGTMPIITHPERNPMLQNRPEQVVEWAQMGCAVQVTANSFTGRWGDRARKRAQWLLERGTLHIIASDCHNVRGRPPVLSEARSLIGKLYGNEVATALVHDNPSAVVQNRTLPYFPDL